MRVIGDSVDSAKSAALEPAVFPGPELLRRYDCPGPRYTSYPTAPEFDADFGEADYRAAMERTHRVSPDAPLSLYVHVPFCANPCFYCACNKVITRQSQVADQYLKRLNKEIERQGALVAREREVKQLHFGGGTPTFLSIGHLTGLFEHLRRHFSLGERADREFSIEIDPRTVTATSLGKLAGLGFNRVSFGVQDLDPAVQAAVNRVQSADEILQLIEAAHGVGFDSISVDLIYGLPLQTASSFERTMDLLLTARPQRVAAYSYAHLPHRFKPQRQIKSENLPSPEEKLQLLRTLVERLTGAGYVYLGMDHFALPEDTLAQEARRGRLQRNFQGYSTFGGLDLVGLGVSAIGFIGDVYAQNARDLEDYYAAIDHGGLAIDRGLRLSAEDHLRRRVISDIMCRGEVRFAEIESAYDIDFTDHFRSSLADLGSMADDGLVTVDTEAVTVSPKGRYLLRAIAMVFDEYLARAREGVQDKPQPRYSRVV